MHDYRVADWMSAPPIVVASTMTLAAAQHLMEEHHVRRLPVVQDDRLIGIVTWGDLRAAWPSAATTLSIYEWRALLNQATIAECMTRDPIAIAADTPVLYAAEQMLIHKISGLPVVADGRVVGVITESDMFRLMIAESVGADSSNARHMMPLLEVHVAASDVVADAAQSALCGEKG
jgi:CBS domain-containing protein